MSSPVESERITRLSDGDDGAGDDGRYVLYWMQASMRAEHNPALEHAVAEANERGVGLVVATVVIADYPDASARHFAFMLDGMGQALRAIDRRGATTVTRLGDPVAEIVDLAADATIVVLDRGYLRHQRRWRRELTDELDIPIVCVEGDVVVPLDTVSDKQETAARTIRSKINKHRDDFISELATTSLDDTDAIRVRNDIQLDDFDDIEGLLGRLDVPAEPEPVTWITPGTAAARAALDDFVGRASSYDDDRNKWASESTSMMSPYLHFGQISPVYIAARLTEEIGDDAEPYLEELIVRRELAMNYVEHCADYDSWAGLPEWARKSMEAHSDDEREDVYTASELEAGQTDDEVWNLIMAEIRDRGWVHNQLRMYWGKQIVQWTNTPQHAHRTLLDLNNTYFLDGRDPSSFANVGWCFGLHDQGFQERDVSGKLRPFTTAALKRKDDLSAWLDEHGDTADAD